MVNVVIEGQCYTHHCTGFIVKNGVYVTATHCFESTEDNIFALLIDGRTVPLHLVKLGDLSKDPRKDVAVMTGNTEGVNPLHLLSKVPGKTQRCRSIGYGTEGYQKETTCVGGVKKPTGEYAFLGKVDHGDSGGPVLDQDGNVIAEQVAISTLLGEDDPLFFAIGAEDLQAFIHEAGL